MVGGGDFAGELIAIEVADIGVVSDCRPCDVVLLLGVEGVVEDVTAAVADKEEAVAAEGESDDGDADASKEAPTSM